MTKHFLVFHKSSASLNSSRKKKINKVAQHSSCLLVSHVFYLLIEAAIQFCSAISPLIALYRRKTPHITERATPRRSRWRAVPTILLPRHQHHRLGCRPRAVLQPEIAEDWPLVWKNPQWRPWSKPRESLNWRTGDAMFPRRFNVITVISYLVDDYCTGDSSHCHLQISTDRRTANVGARQLQQTKSSQSDCLWWRCFTKLVASSLWMDEVHGRFFTISSLDEAKHGQRWCPSKRKDPTRCLLNPLVHASRCNRKTSLDADIADDRCLKAGCRSVLLGAARRKALHDPCRNGYTNCLAMADLSSTKINTTRRKTGKTSVLWPPHHRYHHFFCSLSVMWTFRRPRKSEDH